MAQSNPIHLLLIYYRYEPFFTSVNCHFCHPLPFPIEMTSFMDDRKAQGSPHQPNQITCLGSLRLEDLNFQGDIIVQYLVKSSIAN